MTEVAFATLAHGTLVFQSPTVVPAIGIAHGLAIIAKNQLHMVWLCFELHLFVETRSLVIACGTIWVFECFILNTRKDIGHIDEWILGAIAPMKSRAFLECSEISKRLLVATVIA